MTSEPAMPSDVMVARAVRAHTRALLTVLAAPLLLAGLAAAALSMAGDHASDPPAVAGVSMVILGQLLGVASAVLIGRGLYRLLAKAGTPGSAEAREAAGRGEPRRVLRHTAARLRGMIRLMVIVAVLGIAVWAVLDLSGIVGAIVGAVLIVQVAVVVGLVRVGIVQRTLRSLPG